MTPLDFLAAARDARPRLPSTKVLAAISFRPSDAEVDWEVWDDSNAEFREAVGRELLREFAEPDHALLRYLFDQEVACHRHNEGMTDALRCVAFMLATIGRTADILALYAAKAGGVSFDASIGLDWEIVYGAGVDATLSFVGSCTDAQIRDALPGWEPMAVREEIVQRAADGRPFADWASGMRSYFGLDRDVW